MEELKPILVDEIFFGNPLKALLLPTKVMIMKLSYIALSIAIGIIAWDSYLPVAIFIPFLWSTAPTKKTAWMLGLCYHLAASRGLIFGAPIFFDSSIFYGYFLWFIVGLTQSIPYLLCTYAKNRYLGIILLLAVLILPPIGIVGWANPLTAAGVIFPGTGFIGLLLIIGLIYMMVWLNSKSNAFLGVWIAFVLFIPLLINVNITASRLIKGSITNFTGSPANIVDKFQKDFEKYLTTYNLYCDTEFKALVLPESTAGLWFDSTKNLWSEWQKDLKEDQSIIVSALVPESKTGLRTYNSLIELKPRSTEVIYNARQPVPIGMWKPWAINNVKISWFDNPNFQIAGKKATALICYEAYLTWPVLQSFLAGDPETILLVSNHWWSKNTSLLSIQKTAANAWANLFNAKLVTAINQGV